MQLISMFAFCSLLSQFAGESEAMGQKEFLITNTTPSMVVLRVYGENMICAPFDRSTHEVKKSFSVLKVAEDSKLVLNLENVGPLKPVEKLTSEKITPTPIVTPSATPEPTPQPTVEPQTNEKQ